MKIGQPERVLIFYKAAWRAVNVYASRGTAGRATRI